MADWSDEEEAKIDPLTQTAVTAALPCVVGACLTTGPVSAGLGIAAASVGLGVPALATIARICSGDTTISQEMGNSPADVPGPPVEAPSPEKRWQEIIRDDSREPVSRSR